MELRQIRYFIAVAEELNFRKAAERLLISQPPLSTQIKNLELELGEKLIERSRKTHKLTFAGKEFLAFAYRIEQEVARIKSSIENISNGIEGFLNVGFTGTIAATLLPHVLKVIKGQYPKLKIILHHMNTTEQIEALKNKDIDLGLLVAPLNDTNVEVVKHYNEKFVVGLYKNHPLASESEPIKIEELENENFILTPRNVGVGYYSSIISLCYQAGFAPRVVQEALELHTISSLVSSGIGISILPKSIKNFGNENLILKEIENADIFYHTSIARLKGNNSAMLDLCVEALLNDSEKH